MSTWKEEWEKTGRGSRVVFIILAAMGAIAFLSKCETPTAPKPQPEKTQQPQAAAATAIQEEAPLGKDAAAHALSEYLERTSAILFANSVMSEMYSSKMKQDIAWNNLDKFREDAEAAKGFEQKSQQAIYDIRLPYNLAEADAAQFDAVSMAVDDLITARVTLAVDVAVYANTGMQDENETAKDISEAKRATKALKTKAMIAYKHFGYTPKQIDSATLAIKKASTS